MPSWHARAALSPSILSVLKSSTIAAMSAATSEATTNEKAICDLQDDKLLNPSSDTFMFAIQDQGREKTAKSKKGKNEAGVMTFPKVKKVCLDIYRKILSRHKDRLPSLDSNENRGAQKLEKVILLKQKKQSVTRLPTSTTSWSPHPLSEFPTVYSTVGQVASCYA